MITIKNSYLLEEKVKNIIQTQYDYFLSKPNVIGIGFGYKRKNNFYTCQECLQIFVVKKIFINQLSYKDIIPPIYKGIPTDVIETGACTTCSLTERKRPSIGGYGISSVDHDEYGSIGCLVSNGVSKFLLSTNHVIAGENEFEIGTPITQPSYSYQGRHPEDTIATLHRYVPLRFNQGAFRPINLTDSALGLLTKPNILKPEIALIGNLKGVKKTPKLNEEVRKVGSISELTTGTVQTIHGVITVNLSPNKSCLFHDQIFTTLMTSLGDSGAILVNKANYGLGMSFASTNDISVFCYLYTILDQLDVHLVI